MTTPHRARAVFDRFCRDRARATWWWIAGVVALVLFTVAFWPTVRGQTSFDEMIAELPEAMRAMFGFAEGVSLGSAPGYLQGRMFGSMLPLVLVSCAIGLGGRALAGSEGDGTLQAILATPARRTEVHDGRLAAALLLLGAPAVAAGIVTWVVGAPFGLFDGVDTVGYLVAVLAVWALATMFACLTFAIGAAAGRREIAVAVASGLAVGTYLLQGLLAAANAPTAVRNLVPWHWYLERNMLLFGPSWRAVLLPLVVAATAAVGGRFAFTRRDLR